MTNLFKSLAREALPGMPAELFSLWLNERIENNGWPPVGPVWKSVLGQIPFQQWQGFTWREQEVDLNSLRLTARTSQMLNALVASVFEGASNAYTNMLPDSRIKVAKIIAYIEAHRKLPSKLIFVVDSGEFELIDGCHRLTTYIYYRRKLAQASSISPSATAWIGFGAS